MVETKKWYSYYYPSSGLTRAGSLLEPVQCHTSGDKHKACNTKEEAEKIFSDGLKNHVNNILARIDYLCNNKILKIRLRKYGNSKELKKLELIKELLDNLNKL